MCPHISKRNNTNSVTNLSIHPPKYGTIIMRYILRNLNTSIFRNNCFVILSKIENGPWGRVSHTWTPFMRGQMTQSTVLFSTFASFNEKVPRSIRLHIRS